jgi:hypothetical protein
MQSDAGIVRVVRYQAGGNLVVGDKDDPSEVAKMLGCERIENGKR